MLFSLMQWVRFSSFRLEAILPYVFGLLVTYSMYLACRSSGSTTREGTEEKKEPKITAEDQLRAVCQQYLQVCQLHWHCAYLALP